MPATDFPAMLAAGMVAVHTLDLDRFKESRGGYVLARELRMPITTSGRTLSEGLAA